MFCFSVIFVNENGGWAIICFKAYIFRLIVGLNIQVKCKGSEIPCKNGEAGAILYPEYRCPTGLST